MDDPNQIEVPPSFIALYTAPNGQRLTESVAQVRERYELCEDLADLLTEKAATRLAEAGEGGEAQVLKKFRQGLSKPGSPVRRHEAGWVVRRLAELMQWAVPDDLDDDVG